MKKLNLRLIAFALTFAWVPQGFAAPAATDNRTPAYDLLSGLVTLPVTDIVPPAPAATAAEPSKYENPPCVPSQAILPGRGFMPVVSDDRRIRAINDLLAKIAVCKPMPYTNDGNVHSQAHAGLPKKPAGYYLEYTLIVPDRPTGAGPEPVVIGGHTYMTGSVLSPRGPERLMIGDHREVYYTPDHYTTFVLLAIVR